MRKSLEKYADLPHESVWAQVLKVEGDKVSLRLLDASACQTGECGSGGLGCQQNAFARLLFNAPHLRLTLDSGHLLAENDQVELAMPHQDIASMSLLAYALPLVVMLIVMAIAQAYVDTGLVFVFAVLGVLFTWLALGKLKTSYKPRILSVISETKD